MYLIGAIHLSVKHTHWKNTHPFPGALCLFMSGVRAVQFYSYLPRSESGFHFKSIFYLLPIQMAMLEVTTRWCSTVKSSFPNFEGAKHLTHRAAVVVVQRCGAALRNSHLCQNP